MRLILTGGGTGGHIIPNIALLEHLKESNMSWDILYIGSHHGMEKKMIEKLEVNNTSFQLRFAGISCGKLRRYFSWENFLDVFRICFGIVQSIVKVRKFRPQVIFCKGGYVSFPVAIAGWINRVPVILHESDVVPGLANKLLAKFASVICVSFEESKKYFKHRKIIVSGNPIRKEIMEGNETFGYSLTGFHKQLPVILVMGGSSGALFINHLIYEILPELLQSFQVIHITGEGKQQDIEAIMPLDAHKDDLLKRYVSFEYVQENLKHLYAITDLIISRAGANSLAEIDALNIPSILIPLGTKASRGDQIHNAEIFKKNHRCSVLEQDKTNGKDLLEAIQMQNQAYQRTDNSGEVRKTQSDDAVTIIDTLLSHYENRS